MSKEIPLTKGYVAIVDDEDYERVSQFKWCALHLSHNTYAHARIRQSVGKWKSVYMHRMLLNPTVGQYVDHIDRNGLNNQRTNLRVCTNAENSRNRIGVVNRSSQYKGVSWSKHHNKWHSKIKKDSGHFHLGVFQSEVDAAIAYDNAARLLHGDFQLLNFPDGLADPNYTLPDFKTKQSSQFRGVHWCNRTNSWRAQLGNACKRRFIGSYTSENEAARAYNAAIIELLGFDAALPKLNITFDGFVLNLDTGRFTKSA